MPFTMPTVTDPATAAVPEAAVDGLAAARTPAWQHRVEAHDVDEFAATQSDWALRYEQLSPGRFVGRLQHVQFPGLRLVHEQANCATRQQGRLGCGQIGIAMPIDLLGHAASNGQPLGPDTLMIGRTEQVDLCLPAGAGLIGVVVDVAELSQWWQHLYGQAPAPWMERQLTVTAAPARAAALRRLHLASLAALAVQPEGLQDERHVLRLRDELLMFWLGCFPPTVDTDQLATGEARKRVVDRACAVMLAAPEAQVSMLEVCRRVGASPRKLEYCFHSVLGVSPARYLRTLRLNGVHRELRRAHDGAVHDIAARWGFRHMGEFAAAYRRQFGELPSQTLRSATPSR